MEVALSGRPRAIKKERKEVYTQNDLPPGTLKAWKEHIIPAWRNFAGCQENPWNTSGLELCDELREIWDMVHPRNPQPIDADCPIFVVAVQRWYEWRGSISRAVQVAVDTYMAEYSEDPTVRAAHASFMKGNSERIPFAWRFHPCSSEEPSSYQGLFLSPFISAGLAAYFNMTSSVCEELMVDSEPRGALALATVSAHELLSLHCETSTAAVGKDQRGRA
ncbi:hypothetical protein BDZ97DRAFT_2046850 [Flammula alnicola]|nr:hypothetical protein BDZ97DRAFT_2046850 [Flammula alnicola]